MTVLSNFLLTILSGNKTASDAVIGKKYEQVKQKRLPGGCFVFTAELQVILLPLDIALKPNNRLFLNYYF